MTLGSITCKRLEQNIFSIILFLAGLNPFSQTDKVRFMPQKEAPPTKTAPASAPPKKGKLSFEDYHNTWSGIATSKTNIDSKNICEYH